MSETKPDGEDGNPKRTGEEVSGSSEGDRTGTPENPGSDTGGRGGNAAPAAPVSLLPVAGVGLSGAASTASALYAVGGLVGVAAGGAAAAGGVLLYGRGRVRRRSRASSWGGAWKRSSGLGAGRAQARRFSAAGAVAGRRAAARTGMAGAVGSGPGAGSGRRAVPVRPTGSGARKAATGSARTGSGTGSGGGWRTGSGSRWRTGTGAGSVRSRSLGGYRGARTGSGRVGRDGLTGVERRRARLGMGAVSGKTAPAGARRAAHRLHQARSRARTRTGRALLGGAAYGARGWAAARERASSLTAADRAFSLRAGGTVARAWRRWQARRAQQGHPPALRRAARWMTGWWQWLALARKPDPEPDLASGFDDDNSSGRPSAARPDGGNRMSKASHRRVLMAAMELSTAMSEYNEEGMLDYIDGLEAVASALSMVGSGLAALSTDMLQEQPLNPEVGEFVNALAAGQYNLARTTMTLVPLIKTMHAEDLRRLTEGLRPNEQKWDRAHNR